MDSDLESEMRRHIRECDACMAYDTAVCRGVFALRATSDLEPTRSIEIPAEPYSEPFEPTSPVHASVVGGLMMAAAVTLLLWPRPEILEEAVVEEPLAVFTEPTPPPPAFVEPTKLEPTVSFADSSVPAYRQEIPAPPQREVSFETWVALPQ